uniref:Uncharacterized protein n=1 Tax=Arundo donax TaxID=35708 RepID=A0A0A9DDX3_ARUDO
MRSETNPPRNLQTNPSSPLRHDRLAPPLAAFSPVPAAGPSPPRSATEVPGVPPCCPPVAASARQPRRGPCRWGEAVRRDAGFQEREGGGSG